tara:strand:- start:610 stop:843 length:234 start_codon:yes stop_codon:yes gene_type:complete
MFFKKKFAFGVKVPYIVSMIKIKELRAKIGELASALEKMNADSTPETALTIKVANEVFGKTLGKMQAELARLEQGEI